MAGPCSSILRAYEVLGLPVGASSRELKEAYKRQALERHPDKQQQQQQVAGGCLSEQQQHTHSSSCGSSCSTSSSSHSRQPGSFHELQAAYKLLLGATSDELEAAAASNSGDIMAAALMEEAVAQGLPAATIACMQQQLTAVEAAGAARWRDGCTAAGLTPEDLALWEQLHMSRAARLAAARQAAAAGQQQQQQGHGGGRPICADSGVGLWSMLTDWLGDQPGMTVLVSEGKKGPAAGAAAACSGNQPANRPSPSSSSSSSRGIRKRVQGKGQKAAAAAKALQGPHQQQQQEQQQRAARPVHLTAECCSRNGQAGLAPAQQQELGQVVDRPSAASGAAASSGSGEVRVRRRRSWRFYWVWAQRLLAAKLVIKLLTSGLDS